MRVYFIQHAEAKREEEDSARPLSDKGWKDVEKMSHFLREKGIEVSEILHSGKLRAKQTAEKLAEAINSLEGVRVTDGLSPLDDPNIWSERLEEEENDIMIVGHLPHLSKLASLLIAGDMDHKVIRFRMGGVTCLEKDEEGNWSIQWIIIPQLIGQL